MPSLLARQATREADTSRRNDSAQVKAKCVVSGAWPRRDKATGRSREDRPDTVGCEDQMAESQQPRLNANS